MQSKTLNKFLISLCVISGMFFAAMLIWFVCLPLSDFEAELVQLQVQKAETDEALSHRAQSANIAISSEEKTKQDLLETLETLQKTYEETLQSSEEIRQKTDELVNLPETILDIRRQYGEKIRVLEDMIIAGEADVKICYLTFDDGPNNLTASILDKLEQYNTSVTFFTIAANSAEKQEENLRREMMAGHTVANHSYNHAYYGPLYENLDALAEQVLLQDEFVYNATGFHTDIFRFPGGSACCGFLDEASQWLSDNGYLWVDWNASAWDSGVHSLDASGEKIASNIISTTMGLDIVVVLCHDFNYATYYSMDTFIPYLRDYGYIFLPLLPQSHVFDHALPVV